MDFIQYYIDQYQKRRSRDLPGFAFDIKDKAMEKLAGKSFPPVKNEKYLYTPVAAALEQELSVYQPSIDDFSPDTVAKLLNSDIPEIDSYSILLNNGYHLGCEPVQKLPDGVIVGSFASMVKQFDHICHDFFSRYEFADDVLVNLNTMLSGDGFFVYVPANTKPAKPIQITNLFAGESGILIQPRNLIIMESGSSADVLVFDYTISDKQFVCNDVTDVLLDRNAALSLVRLQMANKATGIVTHTVVKQAASSNMKTHYFSLSGGSVRNNLSVMLTGKDAEHNAGGLSFTKKDEHTDNNVLITHASPGCRSNQLFKHILADTSTSAFTGRIVVDKDAQKTAAYQCNNNILLHPEAKMNIRPQLEIYADDVKCSHGATVGQLDAEAFFYLRSRGIGEQPAKKILLHAFADEVLDNVTCEHFKESVGKLVKRTMDGNFSITNVF